MEWDLKMPPWDMAELERDSEPDIGLVVRSSGSLGSQASRSDCSVDLKLGGSGDFGFSDKWTDKQQKQQQPRMSVAAVTMSPSPTKRTRAVGNGSQNVSCLVDGCTSDLSTCRDYHRRHKVCEVHSKTPIVLVGGQEQRFCQQCSRFHLLIEFDEVKRSCRRRLDGHNRRRRKSQPEPTNPGSLFVNHRGSRFSSYAQIFPTSALEPNWTSIAKPEQDPVYTHRQPLHLMDKQQGFASSSSITFKAGKHFPFLHNTSTIFSNQTGVPTDGLTQPLDSDCALSLLSSPAQASGISLSQIPTGQPLVSSLQYGSLSHYSGSQVSNSVSQTGFSCLAAEDGHVGAVLVSDANETEIHCQGMFQVGGEGSSVETSSALPFSWQ